MDSGSAPRFPKVSESFLVNTPRLAAGERSALLPAGGATKDVARAGDALPSAVSPPCLPPLARLLRTARARLCAGEAYALGNLLFLAGSVAYCALDLLPPLGPALDDALLVGLAALFVADAALYLRAWGGPLVGGGGGISHLDMAAEWVNVAAATTYLGATITGLLVPPTDVAEGHLMAIYVLQALSSVLFFVDALLYAASWRAAVAAAAAEAAAGGGGGGGGGCSGRAAVASAAACCWRRTTSARLAEGGDEPDIGVT